MTQVFSLLLPLCGAALLFGLATVFRLSFYVGFIERPFSVALIWGLCTGDWIVALPLGVFFELFWMDLLGAGTYIPPNANLSLLLCLFICHVFTGQGVAVPMPPLVPVIISLPLAFAGTHLEQRHRHRLTALHEHLVEERQMDKPIECRVIAGSIFKLWLFETLLFIVLGLLCYWLLRFSIPFTGGFPGPENLGWPVLWLAAGLGGLLSLRSKWPLGSFAIALGILSILLFHR